MSDYPFDILSKAEADGDAFDPAVLDRRPFVQRVLRADPILADDGAGALSANRARDTKTAQAREAALYSPSPGLRTAINTAIATGLPLLLTGEPGTGKTQAAWYIADKLQLGPVLDFPVRSTTTARDLIYVFESVRYMADSMRLQGHTLDRRDYVIKQALWKAFEAPRPTVLLIDEIDKAPRDFPNDLLTELDQWVARVDDVPDMTIRVPPQRRPIVVITSNGERALPDAFLRRCVYCNIELTEEMVAAALKTRCKAGEITLNQDLVSAAQRQLFKWRARDLQKKPALAELLTWIGVLETMGKTSLPDDESALPGTEVVIKTRDDRQSLGLPSR